MSVDKTVSFTLQITLLPYTQKVRMEGITSLFWIEMNDKNNSFHLNLFSTSVLGDTLAQTIPHLSIIVFVPTTYNSARFHKTHRKAEPSNIRPIIGAGGCKCYGGRKLLRSIQEKVFTKHKKTWEIYIRHEIVIHELF